MGILQIFTLLGAMGMFLYGMNLMSSGLQKAAGDRLRGFLSAMTSNPFKRVLTGVGITALIQSSSATTVMVVSFVNAGLLTLVQAIGVIMGANIGTTITAWMVSLLGFKADISILAVPLMLLGFLFSNSKKNQHKNIGELIVGFSLLFLGLSFMKESVPDLKQTPEVLEFVRQWSGYGFWSVLIFLGVGTVLVDGAGESRTESGKVRAAFDRVDVVAVRLLDRGERLRILHRHLGGDRHARGACLLALEMDDRGKRLLVRVEIFDELVDAAFVVERLLVASLTFVVTEMDLHTLVQERQFTQTRTENLPFERTA